MDGTVMAGKLAATFVPLLGHLTGLGGATETANRFDDQVGAGALAGVTSLWDGVWPPLRRRPARGTVRRLAQRADPLDEAELMVALTHVLAAEPRLREQATALLERYPDLLAA